LAAALSGAPTAVKPGARSTPAWATRAATSRRWRSTRSPRARATPGPIATASSRAPTAQANPVNTGLENGGITSLAIDPKTPGTLYAGTFGGGVFHSTNSGATWSALNSGLSGNALRVVALAIDPKTPSTLYAGTSIGVFSIHQVAACLGDCDADGSVTVNELIKMVNVALGTSDVTACRAGDGDKDDTITINEIIAAVNNALNGCPPNRE
jgi:hypothetical protein